MKYLASCLLHALLCWLVIIITTSSSKVKVIALNMSTQQVNTNGGVIYTIKEWSYLCTHQLSLLLVEWQSVGSIAYTLRKIDMNIEYIIQLDLKGTLWHFMASLFS